MAFTPQECSSVEGEVYNHFLPVQKKDSHTLSTNRLGKSCNADDCCSDCRDWTDEKWEKVSAYHEKLAIQQEKKKEKVAKTSSSSSSFPNFSSPSVIPIS